MNLLLVIIVAAETCKNPILVQLQETMGGVPNFEISWISEGPERVRWELEFSFLGGLGKWDSMHWDWD